MILLALACSGGGAAVPESLGGGAEEYAGPVGRLLQWAPPELPDADGVVLRIEDGTWNFEWADGTTGSSTWTLDDQGFAVDGVYLLPARLAEGSTADGVAVTQSGAVDVWYGNFPDCVTVEVDVGVWAGTQIFAKDIGPIAVTWNGEWEAIYYE